MPKTDTRKHTVPVHADPQDSSILLGNFSRTVNDFIPVASATERNSVLTALRAEGFQGAVYVDRADTAQIERHPRVGEEGTWEVIAGRQHGASIAYVNQDTTENVVHGMYVHALQRASVGWQVIDNFQVSVPATGMYIIAGYANISDGAAGLGRSFFELVVNGGSPSMRWPATNEDRWGGSFAMPLSAGDRIKFQLYHAGGGLRAANIQTHVIQVNSPRWT